jgi:hypothetical protein
MALSDLIVPEVGPRTHFDTGILGPSTYDERSGLHQAPVRSALAGGLCLPRPPPRQGPGTANQVVDLGMCRLRQTDLGDRRNPYAPLQAAADPVVLGGLSDGHPFQRHLGAATATPTRPRLLQDRPVAVRQAAPQHGGAQPPSAHRRGRRQPLGAKCWLSALSKCRMAGPDLVASTWPRCPTARPTACTPSSPAISPQAPPPRPTAGPPTPALLALATIPMSSATWPPMSCCPGPPDLFQPQSLRLGRLSRPAP